MLDGVKAFVKSTSTKKFLFVQRDNKPGISNPGKWSLLGGGIEEGETPEEALIREVKEESGLKILNYSLLGVFPRIVEINANTSQITMHLYFAKTEDSEVNLTEGQQAKWLTLKEALNLDLVPGLKEFINEHIEDLAKS